MSIKLVDSLQSMGDFPVAFANSIECADGTDLETKLSTLGGTGGAEAFVQLSQDEYDALPDDETGKLDGREYRTYDTGHIYQLGVEFGKETDISSKQDNLSQVKFTMRRNSASEGRYCLIGSSDLSQNLLMCEPYRFQGIFGDGTTSVENKSIIDFMVSFREGVENPDEVLSGFANSSKGFDFVDLLITTDETTNMAYAYVDFKVSGAVATGEITKPVLEAESYMDFAESFELVDTYQGTLVCKMSDYAKIITNIDDTTASTDTVWSSKKTSDELTKKLTKNYNISLKDANTVIDSGNGLYMYRVGGSCLNIPVNRIGIIISNNYSDAQYIRITQTYMTNDDQTTNGLIYMRYGMSNNSGNTYTWSDWKQISCLDDTTSSETSTYSSAKIDELNANRQVKTFNNGGSTAKYYKICSAITGGYPYNIKATTGRIDSTVSIEYFSAIFRDSRYNYTSQVVLDGRFAYNQSVSTYKEYCPYFIVDANQDLYLYVPSYSKTTIEIDTRAITIDGTEGTPVKDYVYNSFDHRFDGRINDSATNSVSTWSSSKIASEISPKADKQSNNKNTDYLKSDRPYLKIARNRNLSPVSYYACDTYILCNHNGDMGALSFIRNDAGVGCVYKNIVGTLPLSVEKCDEYSCWLKYSSTELEIYTVYALNGYTPTVTAVTSTA